MSSTSSHKARAAERALNLYNDEKLRSELDEMTTTALRNLVAAANSAEVLEQLQILVLYQRKRRHVSPPVGDLLAKAFAEIRDGAGEEDPMPEIRDYLANLARLHQVTAARENLRGGHNRGGGRR